MAEFWTKGNKRNFGKCIVCGKPIVYEGCRYCSPECHFGELKKSGLNNRSYCEEIKTDEETPVKSELDEYLNKNTQEEYEDNEETITPEDDQEEPEDDYDPIISKDSVVVIVPN